MAAKKGEEVPDPFFGGEGPARNACIYCGGCMVGCRYNAKNTLVKNYLYLAEKWGAEVRPECEVRDVRPLPPDQPDGARYEVVYRSSTAWPFKPENTVRSRNVVFSAGTLGTLRLLFRCRDVTRSLPKISSRLGDLVRTNSEALLGATEPGKDHRLFEGDRHHVHLPCRRGDHHRAGALSSRLVVDALPGRADGRIRRQLRQPFVPHR